MAEQQPTGERTDSEPRPADAATQSGDQRLRAFLENNAVIAWMKDEDGRHVFLSENYQRRFGVRFEEWQGKTDFDVWPREIADEFRRNDLAVLAGGRGIEVLEEAANPDGSRSWWLNHKFPFQDATGKRYVGGMGVDITDRKRAEEALRASEERYARAVNGANDGIWDWNPLTGDDYLSPRWKQLLGFEDHELPNRQESFFDRVHPDDRATVSEAIRAHFEERQPYEIELRLRCKNGEYRWFSSRGQAMRDEQGQPVRMAGSVTDITGRKAAEAALRESEERLRLALDAARAGTWSWDVASNVSKWDSSFHAQYGFAPHDPVSFQAWIARVHPQDRERLLARIQELVKPGAGDRWQEEFRAVHPLKGERWMAGLGQVYREPDGRAVCLAGINIDVTERKLAEEALRRLNEELEQRVADRTEALREQHERLQAVLNNDFNAMITIDRRGVIESVNPATETTFGYTAAEMIGQNVKMLMPTPFHEEHDNYLRRYQETGEARVIGSGREVVARRRDGSTFPADLAVSEIAHLGLFSGVIRDISERKELQHQVLESSVNEQRRIGQELHDGTEQELTGLTLVAGSLVDLLNAVPAIESEGQVVRTLDERGFTRIRDVATKLCHNLSAANQHVHQLSHGILPVPIDVEGLRSALEELAASTDGLPDITCRFDCPVPVNVANNTTATHLYRIAQEAVNNALRHGQADEIRISLRDHEDQLVLEVCDNGVGIHAPAANHHAPPAGTRGMGLRIMDYRAGIIGGQFHIERGEHGGTRVRCTVLRK